jgi:hypothetical protein
MNIRWAPLCAIALTALSLDGCGSTDDPTPGGLNVVAVLGVGPLCAAHLRSISVVVSADHDVEWTSTIPITNAASLPASVRVVVPPSAGVVHRLEASFSLEATAGAPQVSTLRVLLPDGSQGRVALALPCVCVGLVCPGDSNCAEVPQGSGKTACLAEYSCGNLLCEPGETTSTCPADCAASCGDGTCSPDESCSSCPLDCGGCPGTVKASAGGSPASGGAGQGGAGAGGGAGQGGAGQGGKAQGAGQGGKAGQGGASCGPACSSGDQRCSPAGGYERCEQVGDCAAWVGHPCVGGVACSNDLKACTEGPCTTCESLGVQCGAAIDSCGGTLNCGECTAQSTCIQNHCEMSCPGADNVALASGCIYSYPTTQSGLTATATNSAPGFIGTLSGSCTNGVWTILGDSCMLAASCPGADNVALANGCIYSYPTTQSGLTATATNSAPGFIGTLSGSCTNGVWTILGDSCMPAASCAGGDNVAFANGCIYSYPTTQSGLTAMATNSAPGFIGTLTGVCNNGVWSILGESCQ